MHESSRKRTFAKLVTAPVLAGTAVLGTAAKAGRTARPHTGLGAVRGCRSPRTAPFHCAPLTGLAREKALLRQRGAVPRWTFRIDRHRARPRLSSRPTEVGT